MVEKAWKKTHPGPIELQKGSGEALSLVPAANIYDNATSVTTLSQNSGGHCCCRRALGPALTVYLRAFHMVLASLRQQLPISNLGLAHLPGGVQVTHPCTVGRDGSASKHLPSQLLQQSGKARQQKKKH